MARAIEARALDLAAGTAMLRHFDDMRKTASW
jgi:hypothetical protein